MIGSDYFSLYVWIKKCNILVHDESGQMAFTYAYMHITGVATNLNFGNRTFIKLF